MPTSVTGVLYIMLFDRAPEYNIRPVLRFYLWGTLTTDPIKYIHAHTIHYNINIIVQFFLQQNNIMHAYDYNDYNEF